MGQNIILRYSGLSLGEIEILFNMLRDPFEVSEEVEETFDEEYVSMIHLYFPLAYDKGFFRTLGMDRWEQVKEVLKNLKWRRGRKGVRLILSFGSKPKVSFDINTDDNRTFGKALDTIEYLMDLILFQIDEKRLPPPVTEVQYQFDENDYRWYPLRAVGDKEYVFVSDKWISQTQV